MPYVVRDFDPFIEIKIPYIAFPWNKRPPKPDMVLYNEQI